MRYDQQFFEILNNLQRNIEIRPLILGATYGSGGGLGGRSGGFIGVLPQTRVAYDLSEAESMSIPVDYSGASLLDNLNHIRYRIAALEGGIAGSGLSIEMDEVEIAPSITIVNFEGSVGVVDNGGNKVTVTVSGHTIHNQYLFTVEGVVVSGALPWKIYVQDVGLTSSIEEIFCSLGTAPASSDVRVDILKNGATIFQAPSYVSVTTGNTTGSRSTNFTNNTISKDDYIQADVVQGDATAEDLVIHVRYSMEI